MYAHLICNGLCPQSTDWVYEVSTCKTNEVDDRMDGDIGMGLGDEFETMLHNTYRNIDTEPGCRKGVSDEAKKFIGLLRRVDSLCIPNVLNSLV